MNIAVYIFIILYVFKMPKRGLNNELPINKTTTKITNKTKTINKNKYKKYEGYNFAKNDTISNYTISEIIYKKMLLDKLVDANIPDLVKMEIIKKEHSITGTNLEKGGLFNDWEMGNDF